MKTSQIVFTAVLALLISTYFLVLGILLGVHCIRPTLTETLAASKSQQADSNSHAQQEYYPDSNSIAKIETVAAGLIKCHDQYEELAILIGDANAPAAAKETAQIYFCISCALNKIAAEKLKDIISTIIAKKQVKIEALNKACKCIGLANYYLKAAHKTISSNTIYQKIAAKKDSKAP